jgi:DNA-binding response OmpR family regulator
VLYEPNASARRALAELLQDEGWATLQCEQPGEAIAAAQSGRKIDALLVDLTRGVEVADEVRRMQPGVRVLFMSSRDEGPKDAAADCVEKPIDFRVLEGLLKARPCKASRRNIG